VASEQVSEWSGFGTNLQPETGLEHDQISLERPKNTVQRCSPSNLTELERICREECEKLPKYRFAKLVASYPRILEAVMAARFLRGKNHIYSILE
jgi:hypothetical protein